jgi:hypothetical protein
LGSLWGPLWGPPTGGQGWGQGSTYGPDLAAPEYSGIAVGLPWDCRGIAVGRQDFCVIFFLFFWVLEVTLL